MKSAGLTSQNLPSIYQDIITHPVHWDRTMIIICQSLRSRPTEVQDLFTLLPRLFGTTCCCLSVQPYHLLPLRNIWRRISLTWPFPHRHRHARWHVDVTELFPRFCCWTLIRLSRHSAWLRRGYWHYRNLIDWLEWSRKHNQQRQKGFDLVQ